ncbi:MAG: hypothetical protein HY755_08245 [Nitrospirae bacterium]|nr:hypothetical protein [Nitrospirota bacterium]
MRRFQRRPFIKPIDYSVNILDFKEIKRVLMDAISTDISEEGMGMRTNYPLEPGHVLMLNTGVEHKVGIVRWSTLLENKNAYSIGIKFV